MAEQYACDHCGAQVTGTVFSLHIQVKKLGKTPSTHVKSLGTEHLCLDCAVQAAEERDVDPTTIREAA